MGEKNIIVFLKQHPFLMDVASVIYNILHSWAYVKYGIFGPLSCRGAFLNHVKIQVKGKGCKIVIGRRSRLNHCVVTLRGDNCSLSINGSTTMINNTLLDTYRSGSSISIGSSFSMEGGRIEAMDGKTISIGNNCMFSRGVEVCNGDNHPIYAVGHTDVRLNPSSDVVIGNHVWLGANVKVLKGTYIADDVFVGACALVSGKLETAHTLYIGVPAREFKSGVTWNRQ